MPAMNVSDAALTGQAERVRLFLQNVPLRCIVLRNKKKRRAAQKRGRSKERADNMQGRGLRLSALFADGKADEKGNAYPIFKKIFSGPPLKIILRQGKIPDTFSR